MTDKELMEYRLSKLPKTISFSHFDKFHTCPKRYCVENLDPVEEDTGVYEAKCIKAFPPMGLKVGDEIEFTIENDTYILEGVGEVSDEVFEEHFEDLTELLLPPDQYWAAIGTAIQAFVEHYTKNYENLLNYDDITPLVEHDIKLIADCLVSNEHEELGGKKNTFKKYKIVPDFRNFLVELGNSKLQTIKNKFIKAVTAHTVPALERLSKLDLSKAKAEMKFFHAEGDVTYVGSADLVYFHEPSLASVLDGKLMYNPKKHSKDQLYFYSWLLSKSGIDTKELLFWDYKENKLHPVKYNQYDVNRVGKKASRFIDDLTESVEEDDFPECVNSYCKYCLRNDVCETYLES